jgi:hypothetical protein
MLHIPQAASNPIDMADMMAQLVQLYKVYIYTHIHHTYTHTYILERYGGNSSVLSTYLYYRIHMLLLASRCSSYTLYKYMC